MNCNSVSNILDLHAEGRLSPARAEQMRAHLAACADCAALLAAFAPLPRAASPRAPEAFKKALARRLAENARPRESPAQSWLRLPSPEQFPALAGAAAYASLLLLLTAAGPGVPSLRMSNAAPHERPAP